MEDIYCNVIIVPYSFEKIENMRARRFFSLYKKLYSLCKYSIVFPNLPERLKTRMESDGVRIADGSSVNIKYIGEFIKRVGSYSSSVGLYCKKINESSVSLMYALAEITSVLYIFTADPENASFISDKVFSQCGTPVNISSDFSKAKNTDILVATDTVDFALSPKTKLLDIFSKNNYGISGFYFSIPEKYREISSLCGAERDSGYVEFLDFLGADLRGIRIIGIKQRREKTSL
ncbi:MAG: hypothetical protein J1F64_11145 [Oscillospiraceae bacterium]|nr:hypothetical protein [Oscillospiraceae bacterium]